MARALNLLAALWRRRGRWRRPLPPARQLLSWIDASATGWILLERNDTVGHINPRAERILQRDAGRLLVGQPFAEICGDPSLASSIRIARRQDRPQRLEWHAGGEDLDVLVVPGRDGWLAIQLQNRRSLDAQLAQQERWAELWAQLLVRPARH